MGSISVGDSDYFVFLCPMHVRDMFNISSFTYYLTVEYIKRSDLLYISQHVTAYDCSECFDCSGVYICFVVDLERTVVVNRFQ